MPVLDRQSTVELMEGTDTPWTNPETKTNSLPTHQPTQSTQLRKRTVAKLKKLGADTEDIDEDWIRLQAKTAKEELERRTSYHETMGINAENPLSRHRVHSTSGEEHSHDSEVYHPPHHAFSEVEKQLMNQFESLDYDVVNSELAQKEYATRTYWSVKCDWVARWFVFGLVGVATGTLASLTAKAVEAINEFKFGTALDYLREGDTALACVFFVGISLSFGLVATLLVNFVEPVAAGSGIPQLKAYLNGTSYNRLLGLKTLVVKLVGVIFSVCAGLIIGKEGPMVHSGAVMGANISHLTGWTKCLGKQRWLTRFRNDRDKRDFVSGGTAAGVAAAFGSPVGGVLFALEEAASHWSIQLTWMVFFCSMISVFTLNLWKTQFNSDASFGGLISFGPPSEHPYKVWETPLFLLCGLIGGVFGAAFNELNAKINHFRRDHMNGKPVLKILEVLAIVAVTTMYVKEVGLFFFSIALYCQSTHFWRTPVESPIDFLLSVFRAQVSILVAQLVRDMSNHSTCLEHSTASQCIGRCPRKFLRVVQMQCNGVQRHGDDNFCRFRYHYSWIFSQRRVLPSGWSGGVFFNYFCDQ